MPWDDDITGVHFDIAAEERSPIHVLAGPGTGKTFAMMRRIARLLESGVDPQRILAVTFTRTAARDLREQLESLRVTGAEAVSATTLHSLCFSALSREAVFSVIRRIARPLLSFEEKQMIKDLAQGFGGIRNVKQLLEAYEAAWARMQHEEAGQPQSVQDIEFNAGLIDWLRYHRAMLIGELVPISLEFLRNNPEVPIFTEFEHVLVDEFQDLNRSDQTLVRMLAREGTLTIIGDDNQSIYSFRHANPDGIRSFPQDNPGTLEFVIRKCWRCPPNIVDLSNSLIGHDQRRHREEPLEADRTRLPAEVHIVQHSTLEDETNSIADFIDHYLAENNHVPPGQVLVLTPRRFIGHRIRQALIMRGMNALSYFFEDELKKRPSAEGYCLLKLLVSPNDRAALRAWIGLGSNNGFVAGYARLRAYSQDNALEPRVTLDALDRSEITIPYTAAILERYRQLKERLAATEELQGLELVRALWDPQDEESLDIRLIAESLAIELPEQVELLDAITATITQPELPDSNSDIIRVMSLHKSKGLTASVVIIAGCVAGALPTIDQRSTQAEQDLQLEEQRRLFYVAITRAANVLVVSSSSSMLLKDAMANGIQIRRRYFLENVPMIYTVSSPFLSELGASAPPSVNTNTWRDNVEF